MWGRGESLSVPSREYLMCDLLPSTSSEQTAVPAIPQLSTPPSRPRHQRQIQPKALTINQLTRTAARAPSNPRATRNPQPGDGVAHPGSNAPHLASSLQDPGIAEGPDESGGVRTVEDDAPA